MAADRIAPNLPGRDVDASVAVPVALGFAAAWRGADRLIGGREPLKLEISLDPGLDPAESWFGACVPVAALDGLRAAGLAAGVPERSQDMPRLTATGSLPGGLQMFAPVDAGGALPRCLAEDGS